MSYDMYKEGSVSNVIVAWGTLLYRLTKIEAKQKHTVVKCTKVTAQSS